MIARGAVVLESIEIAGLRGIREGGIAGLRPLSVLVGPNGCGKSTVLDAMLIACSPATGDAIGRCVRRRSKLLAGYRWLFYRPSEGTPRAKIVATTTKGDSRECFLQLAREARTITCRATMNDGQFPRDLRVSFRAGSRLLFDVESPVFEPLPSLPEVRLVDFDPGGKGCSLEDLYSLAVKQGKRREVKALLAEIMPGLAEVEILTEDRRPVVYLVFDSHSVPAEAAGDGIVNLLRQGLELVTRSQGLVLLEEPEAHQHPRAIAQSARAIWAAVRQDVQVILSTHSLDLIDNLLAEAQTDEELDKLAVFNVHLSDGVLSAAKSDGREASFARAEIANDLR